MKSQKGSSFEREVCVDLSLWFSNGESDAIFWRSSQSGGRAKTRSKTGKTTFGAYGDIAAVHPSGLVVTQIAILELKRGYKQWSPFDCLDAKPISFDKKDSKPAVQTFQSFVIQMNEDKRISGIPYSILIYQRDKRHKGVGIETPLLNKLKNWCGDFKFPHIRYKARCDYTFIRFDNFFNWATPESFKELHNELGRG